MNRLSHSALAVGVCLLCVIGVYGQVQRPNRVRAGDQAATVQRPVQPDSSATSTAVAAGPQAVVPRLMKFSGNLLDAAGKPLTGTVDVTFSLYNTEAGGNPLWFETQSVQADELGRYTALLGAMHADGLPIDLFTSGEVRWLGIQVGSDAEQQPRVLLVSVPYALKAGDAETLGGKPASAYMLSETQSGSTAATTSSAATTNTSTASSSNTRKSQSTSKSPLTACSSVTSNGAATVNSIALFTTACNIQSANLVQVSGNLGFGISTPGARLHIFGPDNTDADARFNFILGDSTPATAGVGGGILFSGYYNGTTNKAGFANIRGIKENSTQGNYATAMVFDTRANGGNQTERMRISSVGHVGIGTSMPADPLHVFNGSSGFGFGAQNGIAAETNQANAGAVVAVASNGSSYGLIGYGEKAGDGGVLASSVGGRAAISGFNSGTTNDGVDGYATNASGTGYGVYGESDSGSGYGVYGLSTAADIGVVGVANGTGGYGVYGSGTYGGVFAGNVFTSGYVEGLTGNGTALYGFSTSTVASTPTLYLENDDSTSAGDWIFDAVGGSYGGQCTIDVSGNFFCTGTLGAVAATPTNAKVGLFNVQSSENWVEDYGSGALVNGVANIQISPDFAATVSTGAGYHVFLTPNGDCQGLFVTQKGPTSFQVHEMKGGKSNIQFDYRIVAHRMGYETARLPDLTAKFQRKAQKPAKPSRTSPAALASRRLPASLPGGR
ncbi:MAG TPA: hypothetical protein VG028_17325 [Terriglobia bacterium]|nr:hypothetical protein [Terriglobia bacterium]